MRCLGERAAARARRPPPARVHRSTSPAIPRSSSRSTGARRPRQQPRVRHRGQRPPVAAITAASRARRSAATALRNPRVLSRGKPRPGEFRTRRNATVCDILASRSSRDRATARRRVVRARRRRSRFVAAFERAGHDSSAASASRTATTRSRHHGRIARSEIGGHRLGDPAFVAAPRTRPPRARPQRPSPYRRPRRP